MCDTVSLLTANNEMEISIGNDEDEKINAVLPLFDMEIDKDLRPILKSQIYHLLMTFNCMRNVDTFFIDAYYGLLASAFVRILKYPNSEWKEKIISLIYSTTELVYGEIRFFEDGLELLLTEPKNAVVTEYKTVDNNNKDKIYKCEDVSKVLLNLLVLLKREKISKKDAKEILNLCLYEHFGRVIKQDTVCLESVNENFELVEDLIAFQEQKLNRNNETTKGEKSGNSGQNSGSGSNNNNNRGR